jgi:hypothetical protein
MAKYLLSPVLYLGLTTALRGQVASAPKNDLAQQFALQTDSAQYHVRYTDPWYSATIGYVFRNGGHTAVSSNYCRTPPPPILEKDMGGGHWVRAYDQIVLLCKTIPPFRVAAGRTYRGTLHVAVARPDAHMGPSLEVDSIPGTYRLRWKLIAGDDPDLGRPVLEIVSSPFRLIGPTAGKE